jgi:hypothetical protein
VMGAIQTLKGDRCAARGAQLSTHS